MTWRAGPGRRNFTLRLPGELQVWLRIRPIWKELKATSIHCA